MLVIMRLIVILLHALDPTYMLDLHSKTLVKRTQLLYLCNRTYTSPIPTYKPI